MRKRQLTDKVSISILRVMTNHITRSPTIKMKEIWLKTIRALNPYFAWIILLQGALNSTRNMIFNFCTYVRWFFLLSLSNGLSLWWPTWWYQTFLLSLRIIKCVLLYCPRITEAFTCSGAAILYRARPREVRGVRVATTGGTMGTYVAAFEFMKTSFTAF
jgi:hypothetical protein